MNCPRCGSPEVTSTGFCTRCGQVVTGPPAWSAQPYGDPSEAPLPPAVDPYTSAPITGDPLATPPPYSAPPAGPSPQSYGTPAPNQPYPAQPYPAQPYPAQPYPAQPSPAQQQPYPAQPYPGQQQPYPAQQSYPPFGAPVPPSPYFGGPAPSAAGLGFSITAFVLAAIAVFLVPIVFGVAAIIFASVARRRGERFGPLALKLAVVGTLLGFVFGALVRIV